MTVGFAGLGTMGQPMALNLVRSGVDLLVWNRSAARCDPLREAGARIADGPGALFRDARVIFLMLADEQAVDAVLDRSGLEFARRVRGRTIVHMGTVRPDYSARLEADVRAAGGAYVEAPVSGSKGPAQAGELVAMTAGEADALEPVNPLLRPMCRAIFHCGPVPAALGVKLAINIYLITMVTGLAEAVHFAQACGVDMKVLRAVLDAGPMASSVSKAKLSKLIGGDFEVQAAIADVHRNAVLACSAARQNGIPSPLLDVCEALYREARDSGLADLDMAAVLRAMAARRSRAGGGSQAPDAPNQ